MNDEHDALCPFNSCSFLQLSDSAPADDVWTRPTVLTNDLLPSFKHPTETLQEAGCTTGPRTDGLTFFYPLLKM